MAAFAMTSTFVMAQDAEDYQDPPEFPETVEFTADSPTVTITKDVDEMWGDVIYNVMGTTTKDEVTLTFDLPAEWDGLVGGVMNFGGMSTKKKSYGWPSMEEFEGELPGYGITDIKKGKALSFAADGKEHSIMLSPYIGDEVDPMHAINIQFKVENTSAPAGPVYPDKLVISSTSRNLVIEQNVYQDDDEDYPVCKWMINVTGKANADEAVLTVEIPDGIEGIVGGFTGGTGWKSTKKKAVASNWQPMEEYGMEELPKGNEITIPVDGETYEGQWMFYIGDDIDLNNFIEVTATIEKSDEPEPTDPVIPTNLDIEVSNANVNVKIDTDWGAPFVSATGETEDTSYTMTIKVPADWDGIVYNYQRISAGPLKKAPAKVEEEEEENELSWTPLEELLADGWTTGNEIEIAVAPQQYIMGMFYKGDQACENAGFTVLSNVTAPMPKVDFPELLEITCDSETVNVEQEAGMWPSYQINVTGKSSADKVVLTLEVPKGADGFVGNIYEDSDSGMMLVKRKAQSDWGDINNIIAEGGKKGNTIEIPVDGKDYAGEYYVYAGNMADWGNAIWINAKIEKDASAEGPVVPTEIAYTVEGLDEEDVMFLPADEEYGDPMTIQAMGATTSTNVKITLTVPEGWDGFVGGELAGMIYSTKKKAQSEWKSLDEVLEMDPSFTVLKDNVIEIPVDGMMHSWMFMLYKDDKVDVNTENALAVGAFIRFDSSDLTYPETFGVAVNNDNLKVTQKALYEWENEIEVTGTTDKVNVEITLTVPEGWDGFIGSMFEDEAEETVMRTRAAEPVEMDLPISMCEEEYGMKTGNTIVVPADGKPHEGQYHLYYGYLACANVIKVKVNAASTETGIEEIEAIDSDARFFNLQGVEVKNPEAGVYVKIANGKVSKVNIK